MTDYEERFEGNGEDVQPFAAGDSSPPAAANSHGGGTTEDLSDSKSQVYNSHCRSCFILLGY